MKINTKKMKNEKTVLNECHIMGFSSFSVLVYNTKTYFSNQSMHFGMSPFV